ncbi:MAG: flagellar biosynthetic protein FliQ [Candidatus Eremiobacteraeota bacterium]|nr:flagellar biosynthetic protein FliQ [Candidatus Eremiobacteraeota bacterium]
MSIGELAQLARKMMMLYISLAGPIIIAGMLLGLIVSVVQAITQIQEQTLSFVFKVTASLGALLLLAPWMLKKVSDFAGSFLGNLDKFVR